ncbi:MAG: cell division protein FtsQ/DivIB [Patescibacteria group bacterium]|nr:MAG: cell division protein FtsQ/DivIB [Patescibacteria group bacterium]
MRSQKWMGRRHHRQNPYFKQKKKDGFLKKFWSYWQSLSKRTKLRVVVIFFSLIILSWLFIFSEVFLIKEIKVEGLKHESSSTVSMLARHQSEEKLFKIFPQDRLWVFNKEALREAIMERHPSFLEIKIKKKPLSVLLIEVKEREPVVLWYEGGNYYKADQEGWVVSLVEETNHGLPIIYNDGANRMEGLKLNYSAKAIASFLAVEKRWPLLSFKVSPRQYVVDNEERTIKIVLDTGAIVFLPDEPSLINEQLERLEIYLGSLEGAKVVNLSYIDLRYGDRVYSR